MSENAGVLNPAARNRNRILAAIAAAAGMTLSFVLLPWPAAAFAAALAAIAMVIVATDIEHLIIPDLANVAMAVLGIALVLVEAAPGDTWAACGDALLRAVVAGSGFYLLRFFYRWKTGITGIGLGDVKLAAAGAPFLAWATLPLALSLAAMAGLLAVLFAARARSASLDRSMEVPFGAFLAPAIWLSLIFERNGLFQV